MKDCLEQHNICKANCCRQIKINLDEPLGERTRILTKGFLTKDQQWYWKLRGAIYNSRLGILTYHLNDYEVENHDNYLILKKDCYLLNGYLCEGHPDNKPLLCKALDINKPESVTKKMYITKGCILHKDYKE